MGTFLPDGTWVSEVPGSIPVPAEGGPYVVTVEQAVAFSIVPVDAERVAALVARSTLTVEGQTRYAMVDQYATPAEGTTVARVLLGTTDIEFSHLAMGAYPVYTARVDVWAGAR